ncbi:MAG: hypothetical protein AAGC53_01705 [Actinomycetota bacterium]
MTYDPQANRRRPKPASADPAPVDALLGDTTPEAAAPSSLDGVTSRATTDDPPPAVGVTPAPADPVPDSLVISTGMGAAIGGLISLLTLRWFWKRHQRRRSQ